MKVRSIQRFLLASAVLGLSADQAHADGGAWRNRQGAPRSSQMGEAAMRSNRPVEPFGPPSSAPALSSERMSAAAGHYARARSLLIEALAEFQRGEQIARPDLILDSDQWRKGISSRKDDLDRLLNPQPRVSRAGARFVENRELLRTPREVIPPSSPYQPPVATAGRAQLRGGGVSPADAVPAPKPERASKLRLAAPEEDRAPERPESVSSKNIRQKDEKRPAVITVRGDEAPTVSKAPAKVAPAQPAPAQVAATPPKSEASTAPELLSEVTTSEAPKASQEGETAAKAKVANTEAGLSETATIGEGSSEKILPVEQTSSDGGSAPSKQEQGESTPKSVEASKVASEEDPAVTSKIEDALIQERLKRLAEDYIAEEKRSKKE